MVGPFWEVYTLFVKICLCGESEWDVYFQNPTVALYLDAGRVLPKLDTVYKNILLFTDWMVCEYWWQWNALSSGSFADMVCDCVALWREVLVCLFIYLFMEVL